MITRASYTVTITLCSDTIIGSGISVPGGEDIAVRRDERGFPYINGSTVKGLLRESMENLIAWTNDDPKRADIILGEKQRSWIDDTRRLVLSNFNLKAPPEDSALCYDQRTFTKLKDGIIDEGSLRVAACVLDGQAFEGTLECAEDDAVFVENALKGIRHMGTMRSRGFGHVQFTMTPRDISSGSPIEGTGNWIFYTLHNLTGLAMTDSKHSTDDSAATCGFIPGSAVRGTVLNLLAQEDPAWFRVHRHQLLSQVRFLDALPNPDPEHMTALPSIMGFYEDKQESVLESIFPDGRYSPGLKRASMGSFCALKEGRAYYWNPRTDGTVRIKRDVRGGDKEIFNTQYLRAGQTFVGYVEVKDPELRGRIAKVFERDIWLGAHRYEGYGYCRVNKSEYCNGPRWISDYSVQTPQKSFYLMALSPLTMFNEFGEPCGIHEASLAEKLSVSKVTIDLCATSVSEYGNFNRTLECRLPPVRMYDRGSVFKITCAEAPSIEKLQTLQLQGLGIRQEDGCGMVLALPDNLFSDGIQGKQKVNPVKKEKEDKVRNQHLEELKWLQMHRAEFTPKKHVFYIMLLEALTASNTDEITVLRPSALAAQLGVDSVLIDPYFPAASKRYDRGCVFKISCTSKPFDRDIQKLKTDGINYVSGNAYCPVMLLSEELVVKKTFEHCGEEAFQDDEAWNRYLQTQNRFRNNSVKFAPEKYTLSRSQTGTLQAKCSEALKKNERAIVDNWLEHSKTNDEEKNARFTNAQNFIKKALGDNNDLPAHLETWQQRMELLIRLMDYGRKEG